MNEKMIKELDIDVVGGQIMSRVTVNRENEDEPGQKWKVIIPKSVKADGSISETDLAEEELRAAPDPSRVTEKGDIVLKLSTPYNAAVVDEKSSKCIVPSFCAIIRNNSDIDDRYLLAFLNSSSCRKQLAASVAGGRLGFVSVGKVRSVIIPVPDVDTQKSIGQSFIDSQEKIKILSKIMELELKKNDVAFRELVKG